MLSRTDTTIQQLLNENNTMSSQDRVVDEVVSARKLHANASAWLNSAQRTFDTAKDSLRSAKEAMTEASDSLSLAQEAEMEARSYLEGAQGLISFLVDALSSSNLGPFENNNDVKDAIQQLYPQGKHIPTDMLPFENRLANKLRKLVEAKKQLVRDQPEYAHSMTGQTETTQQAKSLDISWITEIAPYVLDGLGV